MKLIVICGATASGKSDLSVSLAQELGAEIINADSMQLYRGMDIGTAKLSLEERGGIPHHLLDVLDVDQDASVAWYQTKARELIDEIHGRGKDVVVVGGTGLYIKAILDDLNFPDTDPQVRARLEEEALADNGETLFKRLQELDPAAALAIDRENLRRIIRALEVIEITGQPFTANLPRQESTRYPDAIQFGLEMERAHLHERIDRRVDRMWEAGLVDEVASLVPAGILKGRTAQRALGYAQILSFMAGEITEDAAREATKVATRQYARRQDTWFRRDERITWLGADQPKLQSVMRALN